MDCALEDGFRVMLELLVDCSGIFCSSGKAGANCTIMFCEIGNIFCTFLNCDEWWTQTLPKICLRRFHRNGRWHWVFRFDVSVGPALFLVDALRLTKEDGRKPCLISSPFLS